VRQKRYLVAIPIPALDRRGRRLKAGRIREWVRLAGEELTACFGGATPILAPGTNVVGGKVLYERGQVLVVSGCDNRSDFLDKKDRIAIFAERMGEELDQESVFVLAFDSDSLLIEIPKATGR